MTDVFLLRIHCFLGSDVRDSLEVTQSFDAKFILLRTCLYKLATSLTDLRDCCRQWDRFNWLLTAT